MHKTHTQIEKATHENFRYEFFFGGWLYVVYTRSRPTVTRE